MSFYARHLSPMITDESCYFCQDTGLIDGPTQYDSPEYCPCPEGRHAEALVWDRAISRDRASRQLQNANQAQQAGWV